MDDARDPLLSGSGEEMQRLRFVFGKISLVMAEAPQQHAVCCSTTQIRVRNALRSIPMQNHNLLQPAPVSAAADFQLKRCLCAQAKHIF